jgi:hypothetical protein
VLGDVPTQATIIAERFFDEGGRLNSRAISMISIESIRKYFRPVTSSETQTISKKRNVIKPRQ